jgi:hypothetical protein
MRPISFVRTARAIAGAVLLLPLLAACGGGPSPTGPAGGTQPPAGGGGATGGPVTDASRLCDLLGPGDFAAAGIAGAGAPTVNSDGPGSAYCVFAGTSTATGGIEFDAFVEANATDAAATFETIVTESGVDLQEIAVPGADEALGYDGVAGEAEDFAAVVVRKGNLVFTVGAPGGEGMATKLAALATLVLARGAALAG